MQSEDCPTPTIPITPGASFYVPLDETFNDDSPNVHDPASCSLESLNTYLLSRDVSPVRSQLHTKWEMASERMSPVSFTGRVDTRFLTSENLSECA